MTLKDLLEQKKVYYKTVRKHLKSEKKDKNVNGIKGHNWFMSPLSCGLLPDIHLHHYILFVLLLKDNITEEDLVAEEGCFIKFVAKFNIIYETKFATLNFHQLVHLVDQVRQLGALWTHACFTFEDSIRVIRKFIHGSQSKDSQIITAVSFTQKVPESIQNYVDDTCGVKTLKDQLTSSYLPKIQEKLSEHIYRLGALYYKDMIVEEFDALTSYFGCVPLTLKCQYFTRIVFKKKVLIYGTDYRRMIKRNNSMVKLFSTNRHQASVRFAQIRRFLKVTHYGKHHVLCIANNLCPVLRYSEDCHITSNHRPESYYFLH